MKDVIILGKGLRLGEFELTERWLLQNITTIHDLLICPLPMGSYEGCYNEDNLEKKCHVFFQIDEYFIIR